MIGMIAFFSLSVLAGDVPYKDPDFSCIPPAQARQYIEDFSIDHKSFGGIELCDSKIDTKKLFNDLQIIQEGKFQSQGQNNLIRGFVKADQYYEWMRDQTRGIDRGNDDPTATAYNSFGYFTMQDGWASMSTLGRVGTVIHEARHTAGYPHYECHRGSYANDGSPACDRSYDRGGAHAVEMEYYARVSVQGTNFHPVYKSMARLMAAARANFMFNAPVFKAREALLALDGTKIFLYDGRWAEREHPALMGKLKRSSFGAVVLSGQHVQTIDPYQNIGEVPEIKDDYSYFKLLPDSPTSWIDAEEVDLGSQRFMVGVTDNNKIGNFHFSKGEWWPLLNSPIAVARMATSLENGERGLFFVSNQNEIYPFDPLRRQIGSVKKFKWSSEIVDVSHVGSQVLSLHRSGSVFELKNNQWQAWAPSQGKHFTSMVSIPLYDAFEVAP